MATRQVMNMQSSEARLMPPINICRREKGRFFRKRASEKERDIKSEKEADAPH